MGTTSEILVVDDAARMRGLVAKVLAQEGYSVRALPPARDVLQALEEGSADLVASDIRMSEMDGLTLLLHQETVRLMLGAALLVEGAARVPVLPAVQWVSCGWHRRAGRHCLRGGPPDRCPYHCVLPDRGHHPLYQRRSPCRIPVLAAAAMRALVHQHLLASHAIAPLATVSRGRVN